MITINSLVTKNLLKRNYQKNRKIDIVQNFPFKKLLVIKRHKTLETNIQVDHIDNPDFSIDRENISNSTYEKLSPELQNKLEEKKGKRTKLADHIYGMIKSRGPFSMSLYMKLALLEPSTGYYMKSDVFGKDGDFTTSPEISQIFGEMIGLWCASMWHQLGKPEKIRIVELGPGRGTLSRDIMSTVKPMKEFFKSINLNLVEISPHLRRIQAQKFGLVYPAVVNLSDVSKIKIPQGLDDSLKFSNQNLSKTKDKFEDYKIVVENNPNAEYTEEFLPDVTLENLPGTKITWHKRFKDVPDDAPVLVIAHEFFDALPVYQFQYTSNGWREILIDIDESLENPDWFHSLISPVPTPSSQLIKENGNIGDTIEISFESMALSQMISDRIVSHRGSGLFIDYGYDFPSGLTLRGVKKHKFTSIFKDPGEVDLSSMVDFSALRNSIIKYGSARPDLKLLENLVVHGPVEQGNFLKSLGIEARMASLLSKLKDDNEVEALISSFKRIVDHDQMGSTYKVMGIFSDSKLSNEGFELDSHVHKFENNKI